MVNEIEETIDVLEKGLLGERINIRKGLWQISNINSPKVLDLWYQGGNAIYSFEINTSEKNITLLNIHREATKGKGTESLQQLESLLKIISLKLKRQIIIEFPLFDQEDTRVWLEKNKYVRITRYNQDVYIKEIS